MFLKHLLIYFCDYNYYIKKLYNIVMRVYLYRISYICLKHCIFANCKKKITTYKLHEQETYHI